MHQYLTVAEASKIARVKPGTVRDWLHAGLLRGTRVGPKLLLVEFNSLKELLERGAVQPGEQP